MSENNNRTNELVAGSVLDDLSPEEQVELDAAIRSSNFDRRLAAELEETAATIQLAFLEDMQPLPASLRERISADALATIADGNPRPTSANPPSRAFSVREAIAWVGCAAAILVCLSLWSRKPEDGKTLSLSAQRSKLIGSAPDLIEAEWSAGKTPLPSQVDGNVVWSTANQRGFMSFDGLPVNNPMVEQYQLWIIDPERDDEPVDGGVFDITEDSNQIVAISAKLRVLNPQAFAITIEKPGGVVVSTQERLPLIAAVK